MFKKLSCALAVMLFMALASGTAICATPKAKSRVKAPTTSANYSLNKAKTAKRVAAERASYAALKSLARAAAAFAYSEEFGGCLREICNCTESSHNNPRCYGTGSQRSDCPNHSGLECIW